ncbi:MAG: hypothetical protein ISS82_02185 [Nanoarchaeota archaeon]|nr:hypothetical protein [Nanoarchaeota archaeon]
METLKLNKKNIIFVIGALFLVLMIYLFGITGLRTGLAFAILYLIPIYFIMDLFDLTQSEKIIFAFFISLGIYPSLVYGLGFLVPFSFSVFLSFVLLLAIWFLIKKYKKK